jgi:hypothetical protein
MNIFKIYTASSNRLKFFIWIYTGILLNSGCTTKKQQYNSEYDIIPFPKEARLENTYFSFKDTLYFFANDENLIALLPVLQDEFKSMFNTTIVQASEKSQANFLLLNDKTMENEAYISKLTTEFQ